MTSSTRAGNNSPKPVVGRLTPRVKVWFEGANGHSFGAGLIQILEVIRRTGSIKQAAADLGRSYRHVWARLKRAEDAVGKALVTSRVGGQGTHRSDLTPAAADLIAQFSKLRERMIAELERERGNEAATRTPRQREPR